MSLSWFHPFWDKILSQNLQAVADQGCHLVGSSRYKGTAYRGVYCTCDYLRPSHKFVRNAGSHNNSLTALDGRSSYTFLEVYMKDADSGITFQKGC
jgi:hypothetical protein